MKPEESLQIPDEIPRKAAKRVLKEGAAPPKGKFKCGVWYDYRTSLCRTVPDCEKITKKQLDQLKKMLEKYISDDVQRICNELGCPKKQFRNADASYDCKNRRLCVYCEVQFKCSR